MLAVFGKIHIAPAPVGRGLLGARSAAPLPPARATRRQAKAKQLGAGLAATPPLPLRDPNRIEFIALPSYQAA